MGSKHRPFYRICAMDARTPRDGKAIEELGFYDPMVKDENARAVLKAERIDYWLGVGAQPSDKVQVLIKKYGTNGTHVEQQQAGACAAEDGQAAGAAAHGRAAAQEGRAGPAAGGGRAGRAVADGGCRSQRRVMRHAIRCSDPVSRDLLGISRPELVEEGD